MINAGSPDRQYIQRLVNQLLDPSENTRKDVIASLSGLEDLEKVRCLMEFSHHQDSVVRYAVKKALLAIQQKHPGLVGEFFSKNQGSNEESGNQKKVFLIVGFCVAIFLVHSLMTFFFFQRNREEIQKEKKRAVNLKNSIVADAAGNNDRFNLIRLKNRLPVLKVRGYVASVDRMRRTAMVVINSAGDRCLVSFPEDGEMKIASGERVEIEGELLRNDNIGPVRLEASMVKRSE